jgi:hypothetical protein
VRPTPTSISLLAIQLLLAAGCATAPSETRDVEIVSVDPEEVVAGEQARITIEGNGFQPALYRNVNCYGTSIEVDDVFTVSLGDAPMYDVTLIDSEHLEADVPDDLPADTYTVTVIDPRGESAVLEAAFTVTAASDSDTDIDTDTDSDTTPDCSDNLLDNPGAEAGDMSGWTITANGGDGWAAVESDFALESARYFGTSYEWCRRYQQIDLLALGYTADQLDGAPEIHVSEHVGEVYYPDEYEIAVELRDASEAVIDDWTASGVTTGSTTCGPIGNGCHWDDDEWIEESHVFTGYGPGLRYIRFRDGSVDQEWWIGNYGAALDAAEVIICL